MNRRRVSKQQSARIQKIQAKYRQNSKADPLSSLGLVIARFSHHAEIEDDTGNHFHCAIRPNIDSLVAGDRVIWQSLGMNQGVVLSRFPRKSTLSRGDKGGKLKPVAANITQMIIVIAPEPKISWLLLDSYLIVAKLLKLQACILLNKVDLPHESIKRELLESYQSIGYPLIFTTKENEHSYQALRQVLKEQTSVFVGQSGVGKSSLILKILPKTTTITLPEIASSSEFGCHTTSNSRFFHLEGGGALIDSPGVREFGLWQLTLNEITQGYPEFAPFILQCKFRNCNHYESQGCALIAASEKGQISAKRFENFRKLIFNSTAIK